MRASEVLDLLRQAGRVVCDAVPSNESDTLRRVMRLVESARVALAEEASTAATPPRSAEEIAREMVKVGDFPGTRGFVVSIDDETSGLDLDVSEVSDADDLQELAEHAREFLTRVITQARADGAAAALAGQQPRGLVVRIRALVQEYAGRWLEADSEDDLANARTAMQHLRHAYRVARKGFEVEGRLRERLEKMREDTYGNDDPVSQAADELEAIVRECGEQR